MIQIRSTFVSTGNLPRRTPTCDRARGVAMYFSAHCFMNSHCFATSFVVDSKANVPNMSLELRRAPHKCCSGRISSEHFPERGVRGRDRRCRQSSEDVSDNFEGTEVEPIRVCTWLDLFWLATESAASIPPCRQRAPPRPRRRPRTGPSPRIPRSRIETRSLQSCLLLTANGASDERRDVL